MKLAKEHKPDAGGGAAVMRKPEGAFTKTLKSYWRNRYLVGMLFIGLVYYAIFRYGPMYGIQIAFKDYKFNLGITGSPWNDFANFKQMFGGSGFLQVFKNTVIISFYKMIFGFPAPIILAILLNEITLKWFKKTVQTVTYLPYFISWVVLGGILMQVLSPYSGVVNFIIKSLGFQPIFFIGDSRWFRFTLVVSSIWKGVGYGSVIYLASISSINPELYEAAYIDGATRMRRIWHVTIPGMMPVIMINLILNAGSIISDDFDQIFNLYNTAVYDVGDVISTYTYRMGLVNLQYGFSSAVGLTLNVVAFILIIITNKISAHFSEYGIW